MEQGQIFETRQGIAGVPLLCFLPSPCGTQMEQQPSRTACVPPGGHLFFCDVEHDFSRPGKGLQASVPHGTALAQKRGLLNAAFLLFGPEAWDYRAFPVCCFSQLRMTAFIRSGAWSKWCVSPGISSSLQFR